MLKVTCTQDIGDCNGFMGGEEENCVKYFRASLQTGKDSSLHVSSNRRVYIPVSKPKSCSSWAENESALDYCMWWKRKPVCKVFNFPVEGNLYLCRRQVCCTWHEGKSKLNLKNFLKMLIYTALCHILPLHSSFSWCCIQLIQLIYCTFIQCLYRFISGRLNPSLSIFIAYFRMTVVTSSKNMICFIIVKCT